MAVWASVGAALALVVEAAIIALPAGAGLTQTFISCLHDRRTSWGLVPVVGAIRALIDGRCIARQRPRQAAKEETPGLWQRAALRRLLTEAGLIAAFAWLAWRHGLTWMTFVLSGYTVVFAIIIGTDLEHHLILNRVVAPAAVFALLVSPTLPDVGLLRAVLGAAVGFLFMLLPALIMPGGLGAGDVKLAGLLGLATGLGHILTTLAIGVLLGGAATALLLITRQIGRRDYVPYGPFLIAGAAIVFMTW